MQWRIIGVGGITFGFNFDDNSGGILSDDFILENVHFHIPELVKC